MRPAPLMETRALTPPGEEAQRRAVEPPQVRATEPAVRMAASAPVLRLKAQAAALLLPVSERGQALPVEQGVQILVSHSAS